MEELFDDGGDAPGRRSWPRWSEKGCSSTCALLKTMSQEIEQLLALSEEKIYRLAGEKFNINSPKQLQAILFEKLGLPAGTEDQGGLFHGCGCPDHPCPEP